MPVKFEWDLDPGSGDFQSPSFSMDLNSGDDDKLYLGSCEDYYKKSFYLNDHFLHPANSGSESEFYTNPGISPAPLPNDDIWKKFDIMDTAEGCDFEDDLDDLSSLTWMNPLSPQVVAKDAREIRNHDCMWAGHCISEKHDRNNGKSQKCGNLLPIRKTLKTDEAEVVAVTTADGTVTADGSKICVRKKAVVAPTHARSILLPTRIVNAQGKKAVGTTMRVNRRKTLDSGGESPRPETPQSLSDNEDLNLDLPDMKTVEDLVSDAFGYNFACDIAGGVGSEDPGSYESGDYLGAYLLDRMQQGDASKNATSKAGETRGAGSRTKRTVVRQEIPVSRHYTAHSFFSDHCYHLNKNARMDNLGVQTPSDSEEEIDVETVCGDSKKPNSRSSSSGAVLPTNPSLSDRHQLQLTVATAISKKEVRKLSARTSTVPPRYALDERTLKPKMIPCKQRKINARTEVKRTGGGSKRGAQTADEYSEYMNKSVKRRRYQYQRHFKAGKSKRVKSRKTTSRSAVGGSSDSEVDSMERRTIHNSMERQRRIDLRNAFEELRKLIPYTADNEKAAKVVILNCGAEFCKTLATKDSELTKRKSELRRQQEMLMTRVSQLRRSLAAIR